MLNKSSTPFLRSGGAFAGREVEFVYSLLAAGVAMWAALHLVVLDLRVARHRVVFFGDVVRPVRWCVAGELRHFCFFGRPWQRGRRQVVGVIRFWCFGWIWASSPSASRLRPSMVVRGVAHGEGGSLWLAWAMFPSAGSWVVRWRRCWDRIRSSSQVVVAQRRPGFAVIIDMKRRFLYGGVRYGDGGVG